MLQADLPLSACWSLNFREVPKQHCSELAPALSENSDCDSRGLPLAEDIHDFEHYDVEDAVKVVRGLGAGLVETTKEVKHRFREEWVEQLVARYRERPGKPVVHLSDLGDQVIPIFDPEIKTFLQPSWEELVSLHGSEWASRNFRCVWDIMKGHVASRWSALGKWREFCVLTGLKLDLLERYVVAIKPAGTGTARIITYPKLPFNLNTPEGAKILGYRGDADHHTSAIHNLDPEIHDDYKRAILHTVGEVPFTTTVRPSDRFVRTNVGIFVTMLTTVAGLDNSVRQKFARNPIPAWFFLTDTSVQVSLLRTLYEAEGSPTRDALKLSQAVGIADPSSLDLPRWPSKGTFNGLRAAAQDTLLRRPPLLLVSASLLLFQMGIKSYLSLSKLAATNSGGSAYWLLQVYRTVNMRRFEQRIGFVSTTKRAKLASLNSKHTPRSKMPR